MESDQMKSCLLTTAKLLVMVVLVTVVVFGAFGAGMAFERLRNPHSAASIIDGNLSSTALSGPQFSLRDDSSVDLDVFWEVWDIVENEFYKEIPAEEDRVYGAIRGMVGTFGDENTAFIEPTRAALLQQDATGSFEGIGAAVRTDDLGRLVIAEPFPGRPAAEAGLLRGDVVLEVDGQSLRGLSLYESVLLIRGEAGSTVVLTVLREDNPESFEVEVVRAKIEIEVVEAELLDGNIAHLRLSEFSSGASEKLDKAIEEMRQQGATAIILDLRSNPGGFLSESVAVSSLFLEEGVVVRERRKGDTQEQVYEARGVHSATDLPMVVLVNGGSASASEIVAGALRDNGRAIIIGEQSFGKGTVQLPHTLSDGSELRVTIAEWFTPDGNLIHKEGIVPDVVVELTQEDFFDGLDPQLDRAVEYLQGNN